MYPFASNLMMIFLLQQVPRHSSIYNLHNLKYQVNILYISIFCHTFIIHLITSLHSQLIRQPEGRVQSFQDINWNLFSSQLIHRKVQFLSYLISSFYKQPLAMPYTIPKARYKLEHSQFQLSYLCSILFTPLRYPLNSTHTTNDNSSQRDLINC